MRLIQRAVAALAVGGLALALSVGSSAAKPLADWDTSDIMKKINGKGKGAVDKAKKAVAAEKWDDAAKEVDSLKHGEDLVKNKPHKGDKESWEKLAKAYGTSTTALVSAIEKRIRPRSTRAPRRSAGRARPATTRTSNEDVLTNDRAAGRPAARFFSERPWYSRLMGVDRCEKIERL